MAGNVLNNFSPSHTHPTISLSHVNVESLRAHWADFCHIVCRRRDAIVAVSETHLLRGHNDLSFSIPGYSFFRNDRSHGAGGGVALYVRDGFRVTVVSSSRSSSLDRGEYLFLEVTADSGPLLVGVAYCPPKMRAPHSTLERFGESAAHYRRAVILGDFNVPVNRVDHRSRAFIRGATDAGLSLLSSRPTHHTRSSNNSLDLIFTAGDARVVAYGQEAAPGLSRHDLVFCSISGSFSSTPQRPLFTRDFKTIDLPALLADPALESLDSLRTEADLDACAARVGDLILEVFDRHAPVRKIKGRRPPAPWLSPDIRRRMAHRDKLYRLYTRDKSPANWEAFRVERNRVKQIIRNGKNQYFTGRCGNKTSDLWKVIRSEGGTGPGPLNDVSLPLVDLLDNFSSRGNSAAGGVMPTPPSNQYPPFAFAPVTEDDVEVAVGKLVSRTPGPDGIVPQMVRLLLPVLKRPLTRIANASLSSGCYPSVWKRAHIIPLPKVQAPSSPDHFRPISVGNCLGKVLDLLALQQLSSHVFQHGLLCGSQSAFRPHHSTHLALVGVLDPIREAMDRRHLTVLVSLDISRAYDTVDHAKLLRVVESLNFEPSAVDWVASFLSGRTATIRVPAGPSPGWRLFPSGVPQGSCMSPLLFNLFLDGVARLHVNSRIMLYADDVLLLHDSPAPSLDVCVQRVNEDLECLNVWFVGMGLSVNPCKSKAMVVGNGRLRRRYFSPDTSPLVLGTSRIPYVPHLKYLGIIIEEELKWSRQVSQTISRVHWGLRRLRGMQYRPDKRTKMTLVKTLLFPILDYCMVACSDLTGEDVRRLQVAQNACMRYALRPAWDDHVTPLYVKERVLKFKERKALLLLLSGLKVWREKVPQYVYVNLGLLGHQHQVNTRHADVTFTFPHHRSSRMASSFLVSFARGFNSLPARIKADPTRPRLLRYFLGLYSPG